MTDDIDKCLARYQADLHLLKGFCGSVRDFFLDHPLLNTDPAAVHSVKSRLKDPGHLRDKLSRKASQGVPVTPDNLYKAITDLAGVRVIHLYQGQFSLIHEAINEHVAKNEWAYYEPPKAYTWDPDSEAFFKGVGLETTLKASHYTSVHYVVKPRADSDRCCEIQVRTLFEEAWGELDHRINYPYALNDVACLEQIRVLSKIVGAGSRLADAIIRTHEVAVAAAKAKSGSAGGPERG